MKEWIEINMYVKRGVVKANATYIKKGLFKEYRRPFDSNEFFQNKKTFEVEFADGSFNSIPKVYNYSLGMLTHYIGEISNSIAELHCDNLMDEMAVVFGIEDDDEEWEPIQNKQLDKPKANPIDDEIDIVRMQIDEALDDKDEEKFKFLSKKYNELNKKRKNN